MNWPATKRAFYLVSRPIEYQTADGSRVFDVAAIINSPSPEELAGGLPVSARVVHILASAFSDRNIRPAMYDKVRDPRESDRTYVLEWEPVEITHGSSRFMWRLEVNG